MLILDYLVDPKGSHTKLMRRAQAVLRSKPGGKDTEMRERWCNNRGRDWNDGATSQRMKRHEQAHSWSFWREHSPAYTLTSDLPPPELRQETSVALSYRVYGTWLQQPQKMHRPYSTKTPAKPLADPSCRKQAKISHIQPRLASLPRLMSMNK